MKLTKEKAAEHERLACEFLEVIQIPTEQS